MGLIECFRGECMRIWAGFDRGDGVLFTFLPMILDTILVSSVVVAAYREPGKVSERGRYRILS